MQNFLTTRRLTHGQAMAVSNAVLERAPHIQLRVDDIDDTVAVVSVLKHRDGKRTNDDLNEVAAIAKDVLGYETTRHEIGLSHLYALGEGKPKTR